MNISLRGEMSMCPSLIKDQSSLTVADFEQYPVWVRVIDFDRDRTWISNSTEVTYRPWNGALPFKPDSPFASTLVRASFRIANGSSYPGYMNPVGEDWDLPLPPRRMKDGTLSGQLQWSKRRGGTPLSILALHSPVMFIRGEPHDFHLRRYLEARERSIRKFYEAIGQQPEDVFPIEFASSSGVFCGITSGRLEGFYKFPLDKPWEIDTGSRYLADAVLKPPGFDVQTGSD